MMMKNSGWEGAGGITVELSGGGEIVSTVPQAANHVIALSRVLDANPPHISKQTTTETGGLHRLRARISKG